MTKENSFNKEAFVHYNYFINIAKRYTRNQMDAEDLVQDTFIRAFKFYDTFRQGSNCKAWLFTIMKNIFINYNRKYRNISICNFEDIPEKREIIEESEYSREELINLL